MEDLHTAWVGRCEADQFFIATTLARELNTKEKWVYITRYLFSPTGEFKEAAYTKAPFSRAGEHWDFAEEKTQEFLTNLGPHTFGNIAVKLFEVHMDGIRFGLVYDQEKNSVDLEPGPGITFTEPWDGEYYT